jgi:hypothetical protein
MSLQIRIIEQYKKVYPNQTLREISLTTGIQLTRIFRILNGSAMKLSEFEKFQEALDSRSTLKTKEAYLIKKIKDVFMSFDEREIDKISDFINRQFHWKSLMSEMEPPVNHQSKIIA